MKYIPVSPSYIKQVYNNVMYCQIVHEEKCLFKCWFHVFFNIRYDWWNFLMGIMGPLSCGESYRITVVCLPVCLSIHLFSLFCRNGSLVFSDFLHDGENFFPEKSIFVQIWAKRTQNRVFWIFWKILSLLFPGNNVKWKLTLLLIVHHQSCIWQNSELKQGFFKLLL